jgi:hypothetical protein
LLGFVVDQERQISYAVELEEANYVLEKRLLRMPYRNHGFLEIVGDWPESGALSSA